MPTPTQIREERLMKLFNRFKDRNVTTVDLIYREALTMFPTVSERTNLSYARAVLRMIEAKKKRGE